VVQNREQKGRLQEAKKGEGKRIEGEFSKGGENVRRSRVRRGVCPVPGGSAKPLNVRGLHPLQGKRTKRVTNREKATMIRGETSQARKTDQKKGGKRFSYLVVIGGKRGWNFQ